VRVSWERWARAERAEIAAADRWRTIRELDSGGPVARIDGCEVVSFASNDYFALSQHPAVRAAAHEAIERWGTGAGSARLIAGSRPVHSELERELADWKGAERALLFPTGFAANLGVLSVVGGPDVTIISDQLNHASIIDGCRLARGEVWIYRHGDIGQVAQLLRDADRAVVVTDSVFSMDGDLAPLAELARLCAARDALLVIDEAHAALGPEPPRTGAPVLRVGTLSKMLGSVGGFVAGPGPLVDLIINRARSFIFTTAPAPPAAAAALAALRVLRSGEGDTLRARLAALASRVRPGHPSPIIPVVLGDESAAVAASRALLARGLLVPAIRPPTVPPGTSRLRVALSAAHSDEQISRLLTGLAAVVPA
jgi:8-amino-7-oxononanoate synthase